MDEFMHQVLVQTQTLTPREMLGVLVLAIVLILLVYWAKKRILSQRSPRAQGHYGYAKHNTNYGRERHTYGVRGSGASTDSFSYRQGSDSAYNGSHLWRDKQYGRQRAQDYRYQQRDEATMQSTVPASQSLR